MYTDNSSHSHYPDFTVDAIKVLSSILRCHAQSNPTTKRMVSQPKPKLNTIEILTSVFHLQRKSISISMRCLYQLKSKPDGIKVFFSIHVH